MSTTRSGIIAGGNWIVDQVKLIDRWPPQDALANIQSQFSSNGGSPYNLLKNLARLGAPFSLEAVGRVGRDEAGRFIREDCALHRIDTRQLGDSDAPTSYTDVMTEQGSGRRTFFHCRGANAELGPEHFDFRSTRARVFHLGYLMLLDRLDAPSAKSPTAACDVLRAAREAGLLTSVDVVSDLSDRFGATVLAALPEIDGLFLNEFELGRITGRDVGAHGNVDRSAIEAAARELLRGGVRQWVVVHFPGAVAALGAQGETHWQPSLRLPEGYIRGAAGAGDAVASGVLYGWHEGWPMAESLRLGVCAAAASLAHPTCSEGVGPRDQCLSLAATYGFQDAP